MHSASPAALRMIEAGLAHTWRPPAARDEAPVSPPGASNDAAALDPAAARAMTDGFQVATDVEASHPNEPDADIAPPPLVVIDAPKHLEVGAPAAVVRDADGRHWMDYDDPSILRRRGRSDVDAVMALGALGEGLLAAVRDKRAGVAIDTFIGLLTTIRVAAAAIERTPFARMPIGELPADFVDQVGAARDLMKGHAPRYGGREQLNKLRKLLAEVPGTGHLDLARRSHATDLPGQWTMVGGEFRFTPRLGFTDADVEALAKRASFEIRETIARRNQFVAFRDGEAAPAGPSSLDGLRAASLLLDLDRSRPTYWKEFLKRRSDGYRLFFDVGWAAVAAMAAGEHDADVDPTTPGNARLVAYFREHVDGGGDGASYLRGDVFQRRDGFVAMGWGVAVRIAYPTCRDMIAPAVSLGIVTRLNPTLLRGLEHAGFRKRDLHWTEIDEDGEAPLERIVAAPYKPRARRLQPLDFPVTTDPEDPAPLTRFVQDWTSHIRRARPVLAAHLFLFVNDLLRKDARNASFASAPEKFTDSFSAFCTRAGAPGLTPKVLRTMGIDIVHESTGGDQMMVHAAGNWAIGSDMPTLYQGGPALGRDRERLFWADRILKRQRVHGIVVDERPRGADLFAVEDGFACRRPTDGPDPLPPGELCRSRGTCAICPHARLDLASPSWSFARLAARAFGIARRLRAGASPGWARRYRPVLAELLEIWLPMFPEDVVAAARRLPDYPCLELPDVE